MVNKKKRNKRIEHLTQKVRKKNNKTKLKKTIRRELTNLEQKTMNSKNEKLKLTNEESTLLEKLQKTLHKLINKT